jgi:hypothetical protein
MVATSCSDDGVPQDSVDTNQGDGTGKATTGAASTTAGDGVTSATDGGGEEGTSATASATAAPSTGTGDGTAGTGSETGSDDSTGTTGGMPTTCESNEDCVVVNDCCSCTATHMDDPLPQCRIEACRAPICDVSGIPDIGAVCALGQCRLEELACNQALVSCDAPTPGCEDGFLPEVADGCWTGNCVPTEACDVVPDCSYCQADDTCVELQTQLGNVYECTPTPESCGGEPDCACIGEVCEEPFQCADEVASAGDISCVCLAC